MNQDRKKLWLNKNAGWPQVLESPGKIFAFFPGPGKSL